MINNKLFSFIFLKSETGSLRSLRENVRRIDVKVVLICLVVAFSLTCTRYLGDAWFLIAILQDLNLIRFAQGMENIFTHHANAQLHQLSYWAAVVIFFYFVLPVCIILFVFKESLSNYGWRFKGALKGYQLYLGMLIIMVPLVFYFSGTKSFLARYPFYNVSAGESLFPNFFIWEIFYFLQFIALEFFFRGFIVHGTKHRFGFYAIFVMVIPYCMIHFGKPMAETIAAIIAGVVLGFLSLKSKSIWLGVMIHCSIALTMDLCALVRKGVFQDSEMIGEI
ncbi:Abortive infection protein [Nitrosomonas sp. Is79A3]|uniref:CPBP family glutamic-type intramembrane protease n=1 Tax=Nitrosomonas sp. (strain Is79A3) TaxID=261292 RepID=UPI000215CBBA